MLVGGLLASVGMVAAAFCGSIIQLYLTTGVITGEPARGWTEGWALLFPWVGVAGWVPGRWAWPA